MFIGYYEDACEDPAEFLRTVFEFLGVDARQFDWNSPILGLRRNVGGYPMPERFRKVLSEQYKEEIGNLHDLLGSRYTKEWISSFERTAKQ